MTNNEHPELDALISVLADDDNCPDPYAIIAELKPFMPGPMFETLALSFDMCPIHMTDLDGCADDDVLDDVAVKRITEGDIPLSACRHLRQRPDMSALPPVDAEKFRNRDYS